MNRRELMVKLETIEVLQFMVAMNAEEAAGNQVQPEPIQPSNNAEEASTLKKEEGEMGAATAENPQSPEAEEEESPRETQENIPTPPEPMDEGSRPANEDNEVGSSHEGDDANDDDDDGSNSSSQEHSAASLFRFPGISRAIPSDPNYLQHRLPKSQDDHHGEDILAEGDSVVQALGNLHEQLESKPADDVNVFDIPELKVRLWTHQEQALSWMLWRETCQPSGGILADDMGLGKTVTTIAVILNSLKAGPPKKDTRLNPGGTLIICHAALIPHWTHDLSSKANITNIAIFNKAHHTDLSSLQHHQVVLTSYGGLSSNYIRSGILFKIHWQRVILDDAHIIRNSNSRKSLSTAKLEALNRWALTGCPVNNNIEDLYAILRFLRVQPFDDKKYFHKWINNGDVAGMARLHCILDTLMLRRTKDQLVTAGFGLPLRRLEVINVVLAPRERQVYERVLEYSRTACRRFLHERTDVETWTLTADNQKREGGLSSLTAAERRLLEPRRIIAPHTLLTLILRLRQICCHPALIGDMLEADVFRGAGVDDPEIQELHEANVEILGVVADVHAQEPGDQGDEELGRDNSVFRAGYLSSKTAAIVELVQRIVQTGDKVMIVSEWVRYLALIGQQLENVPGATFEVYIGTTSNEERAQIIQRFDKPDGPTVLLMSMHTISHGLNITAANHVIIADVHWNPQMEISARDLVYRMGQTKDVVVHKIVCKDTIEEKIVALQQLKLETAEEVLTGAATDARILEHAEIGELLDM